MAARAEALGSRMRGVTAKRDALAHCEAASKPMTQPPLRRRGGWLIELCAKTGNGLNSP